MSQIKATKPPQLTPHENRTKDLSELLLIEGKTKAFRPATLIQQLSLAPLPLSPKELQFR